jgi:hypothetical protein
MQFFHMRNPERMKKFQKHDFGKAITSWARDNERVGLESPSLSIYRSFECFKSRSYLPFKLDVNFLFAWPKLVYF